MKKLALVLAVIITASCFAVLLTGCGGGGGSNKFIGTWEAENGEQLIFKSGGKYTEIDKNGFSREYEYEVKDDDEIYMGYMTYNYKLEGDKLEIYYMGMLDKTYYKK
ncbi:MAG: hypothetical protein ACI3XF_00835 [Eubacteriales bacterium]